MDICALCFNATKTIVKVEERNVNISCEQDWRPKGPHCDDIEENIDDDDENQDEDESEVAVAPRNRIRPRRRNRGQQERLGRPDRRGNRNRNRNEAMKIESEDVDNDFEEFEMNVNYFDDFFVVDDKMTETLIERRRMQRLRGNHDRRNQRGGKRGKAAKAGKGQHHHGKRGCNMKREIIDICQSTC